MNNVWNNNNNTINNNIYICNLHLLYLTKHFFEGVNNTVILDFHMHSTEFII